MIRKGIWLVSFFLFVFLGMAFAADGDFTFVQMSDTHWGFNNTNVDPDYAGVLKKAVKEVNDLKIQPDFIIFTGDLTHTTDDPQVRRQRMTEFKAIIKDLKAAKIYFIPGEHDASLDNGQAFKENFGDTHYAFDYKGVHFVTLDNVSDPSGKIGDEQLAWFGKILSGFDKNSKVVIFTHRPLFDLNPEWDWWTADGSKALDLLKPFKNVSVFYGHIHQININKTGDINHYAAQGLMYPLPASGSVPKKAPVPWDPAVPYKGLGFRTVGIMKAQTDPAIREYPIVGDALKMSAQAGAQTIRVTAKKFEFSPSEIHVKKGSPVVLEFTSLDRLHGFSCPGLKVSTQIEPGKTSQVSFTADQTGEFKFFCSVFCGDGHSDMTGKIIVEE